MGYCTKFKLEMRPACQELLPLIRREYSELSYAINNQGNTIRSISWSDHEDDLLSISRKYPDILFTLSGEGEDKGDLWKKYFKNGLVQTTHAEIIYESFDENKLGPPEDLVYQNNKWAKVKKVWDKESQKWLQPKN